MAQTHNQDAYREAEAVQRRDDALRRALNTPPRPHAIKHSKAPGPVKARTSKKPATTEKPARPA